MKQEDNIRMSASPPTNYDHASLYARLFANGNILPQQFLAEKSALMSQLPLQLRASLAASATNSYYPHHTTASLFGGIWSHPTNVNTSPPMSPNSTTLTARNIKKNNNNTNNINNNIVSTTTDHLPKKLRTTKTLSVKMNLLNSPQSSIPMDIPLQQHHEMINPAGPISPPTSGSSPQSNGSIEHPPPLLLPTSTKDPRDKLFTCKICSRSFGYKHVLQNHERTHTGEKPFECPECHKRFTRDHHLKTHMRLHTGEKPYHCDHCDRHFVQVANLRRHMRVHTGEKPYKCEVCKSTFADSNQLKGHKTVHTDKKPFTCEQRREKFRRRKVNVFNKGDKCSGHSSPPTPVMSPTMSLSDNKSASSHSDISELSVDISRTSAQKQFTMQCPMDLSEDAHDTERRSNRKSHDVRRILRMPLQISHNISTIVPEQTEPEDLSMHSPRSNVSNDEDLDDLDDAASLFINKNKLTFFTT